MIMKAGMQCQDDYRGWNETLGWLSRLERDVRMIVKAGIRCKNDYKGWHAIFGWLWML